MKGLDLKLGLRTLFRNRLYSILNILGLSIGMASAILIFLWVEFQISYDRFHTNSDLIYKVIQDQFYTNGEVFHVNVTPSGMANTLKENIGGITHSTRYNVEQYLFGIDDNKMIEHVSLVDPDFFSIFSFPLIKGNPEKIFEGPHSMVISEKIARKYFGDLDPIGNTVLLNGNNVFTITGILKDVPKNTTFRCDILIPFIFYKEMGVDIYQMGTNWITTFVQLSQGMSADTINSMIEFYKKKNFPKTEAVFYLQPLKKVHLYWVWGGGPIKNVRLFSIIAVLIIFIAAINFTNLSTAMAARRYTEIGIKKSYGADRSILIWQFLTETFLLTIISLFIALILTESFLPWYNSFLKTDLHIDYTNGILIAGIIGILVITAFLSGVYPAFFLSSFKPVTILKAGGKTRNKSVLREVLVVLQFGLAIVLIVNTIIIKKQQEFLKNQEIGIQKENIIYMPLRGDIKTAFELFKTQLSGIGGVQSVSLSSHLPTGIWSNGGGYNWQGKAAEVDPLVSNTTVDFDYADLFGIKMQEGEFYPKTSYTDTIHVVINKTFADIIGLKPIIGETLEFWGMKARIIGVTEDFNFKPLHSKIEPLVMIEWPEHHGYVFCKLNADNLQKTIKQIEKAHNALNSEYPFEYRFLDEEFSNLYINEQRQGKIFNVFAFLAIFISCLGLFGLSSFMMTQRTKEIGIRKANGATLISIVLMFSKYYVRWILTSFIIALPVSYYLTYIWLKNYAYRTNISWWIFPLAGIIAFAIALATVGWQSWKAAKKNPVEALRYE